MKNETTISASGFQYITSKFITDPASLFNALKNRNALAIIYLQGKILNYLEHKKAWARSSQSDIEELTNDAIMITLQKIDQGKFKFQGQNPIAYSKVIAENLMRNFSRKKQLFTEPVETNALFIEAEAETNLINEEVGLEINRAFDTLGENGKRLIELKYYDGLSDAEIIAKKLTIYSTIGSLKNRRCQYMKKLAQVESLRRYAMS